MNTIQADAEYLQSLTNYWTCTSCNQQHSLSTDECDWCNR